MRNLLAQKPDHDPLASMAKPAIPDPLVALIIRCRKSPDFVLCASYLGTEKDGAGNLIMHHDHIRENLCHDDVAIALEGWQKLIEADRRKGK
jgi:hypothetical protein